MSPRRDLTEHEVTLLRLAAHGLSTTQISLNLSITVNTVKKELSIIRDKLGAINMAHAVAIAITKGYLKLEMEELNGSQRISP